MATVHVYAKLRNYPKYPRSTLREVGAALLVSIPALMTPVIIIGGKIFGWFTATESAAIAVVYAAVLSIFVYRELKGSGLYEALIDTGKLAGVALFCVGTASAFGWLLAYYQIPKALLAGVGSWGMGSPPRASSSPSAFSSSAASSMRSRRSSSSAPSSSRSPRRCTWIPCTSR
jgi:TRAP-type C4-dicarboxylate transport system permease large subunit